MDAAVSTTPTIILLQSSREKMLSQTSLEAYRSILLELGDKQLKVLRVFKGGQALTNMEVAEILGWSINRVTPRVLELREKSLLEEKEKRFCAITGRRASAWKRSLRCLGDAFL